VSDRPGDGLGREEELLLSLAEEDFDVFLTMDQGFEHQQNITDRKIAVLLLVATSNQIEDLAPTIPSALLALQNIRAGQVVRADVRQVRGDRGTL
jgi:hypothetical protein